jgi:hypothetical protein
MRIFWTLVFGLFFALSAQAQLEPRAVRPGYSGGNMVLELNGKVIGAVRSLTGGAAYAEVTTDLRDAELREAERQGKKRIEQGGQGSAPPVQKRIGPVRYEPMTIEIGLDADSMLWDMLRTWADPTKQPNELSGAIVFADFNMQVMKRLDFTGAVLTGIALPALDAREGKSPFTLTLTLQPRQTKMARSGGRLPALATGKNRQALCSNFRLNIEGLDLMRITRIEGLTLVRKRAGGSVECSDLVFTIPENGSTSVENWFQDSVLNGSGKEQNARLEILSPDFKTVLVTINLRGVGILRLGIGATASGAEAIRTLEARAFVEGATIEVAK